MDSGTKNLKRFGGGHIWIRVILLVAVVQFNANPQSRVKCSIVDLYLNKIISH